MVERYKQPGLPSPVVGTPGVDQSAGKAADQVAAESNAMVSEQQKFAQGLTQQAGNEFQQAQGHYAQIAGDLSAAGAAAGNFVGGVAGGLIGHQIRANKLKQAYQADLAFASIKPLMDADALKRENALKQQYAGNDSDQQLKPQEINSASGQQYSDFTDQWVNKYAGNKLLQEKVAAYAGMRTTAGQEHLGKWGEAMASANQDSMASKVKTNTLTAVGSLPANLDPGAMIGAADQVVGDNLAPVKALYNQARVLTPEKAKEYATFGSGVEKQATEQTIQHGMSALDKMSDTSKALDYAQKWSTIIEARTDLDGHQKEVLQNQLESAKKAVISNGNDQLDTGAENGLHAAKVLQGQIAMNAYKGGADGKVGLLDNIKDYQSRVAAIEQQRVKTQALPDSDPFKLHKLQNLDKQYNAYVTDVGLTAKDIQNQDTMQRVLQSFAEGQVRFGQSQLMFAHATGMWAQQTEKAQQAAAKTVALNTHNSVIDDYKDQMTALGAHVTEDTDKQADTLHTKQINAIAGAYEAGTISHDQREHQINEANKIYNEVKSTDKEGSVDIFGQHVVYSEQSPATADELKNQSQKTLLLNTQINATRARSNQIQKATVSAMRVGTTSAAEAAQLHSIINTGMPTIVDQARKAGYTEDAITKGAYAWAQDQLTKLRKDMADKAGTPNGE